MGRLSSPNADPPLMTRQASAKMTSPGHHIVLRYGTQRRPENVKNISHLYHTCPNGLFLFTVGLFYKKWDGLKISPIS